MHFLYIALIAFLLGGCVHHKDKKTIKKEPMKEIQEQKNTSPLSEERDTSYDYVVSETAVGRIENIPFTLGSIYKIKGEQGKTYYIVTMDINKKEFVDIKETDIVRLDDNVQVQVIKIEYEEAPKKGKVYFKLIK